MLTDFSITVFSLNILYNTNYHIQMYTIVLAIEHLNVLKQQKLLNLPLFSLHNKSFQYKIDQLM